VEDEPVAEVPCKPFALHPPAPPLHGVQNVDPDLLVCRIDPAEVREARRKWLFKRDEKPEAVWRSLERIVRAPED
jgi:hypothetical protein